MSYTELRSCHPIAAKHYRCNWCDQTILKGERHHYRVFEWEGEFSDGRMHLECETAMMKSDGEILGDGWMPGAFKRGQVAEEIL